MNISDFTNSISNSQSSVEDDMKNLILSLSREFKLDVGHVLPEKPLLLKIINLNPKKIEALIPALNALIEDGIFEDKNGKAFLTEKGRDLLYSKI